jgi:acylphosphatase
VRNLPDGNVEAVFEGGKDKVEEMIEWCKKGPSGARVDDVFVSWEEPEGLEGFDVRR